MTTEAFHDGRGRSEVLAVSPVEEDWEYFGLLHPVSGWRLLPVATVRHAAKLLENQPVGAVSSEYDLENGTWSNLLDPAASPAWPPPIVVVSRHADEAMWARVLNLGGYDVLIKPFDATEVRRAVGSAARRRSAWTSPPGTPIPDMIGAC